MEVRSSAVEGETEASTAKPVDYFPSVSETQQFYASHQQQQQPPNTDNVFIPGLEIIGQKRSAPSPPGESGAKQLKLESGDPPVPSSSGDPPAPITCAGGNGNTQPTEETAGETTEQAADETETPQPPPRLTEEDITAVNQEVINTMGTMSDGNFICTLCIAELCGRKNVQKHVNAAEHNRRIVAREKGRTSEFFCEVCCCPCMSIDTYAQHLKGKKHLRSMQITDKWRMKGVEPRPVGELLEGLMKLDEVSESGDGRTMGVSPTMLAFMTMPGPFIGLQYAEEVGVRDDPVPTYVCSLCKVSVDAGNASLHFTSTAHRVSVLKKDYAEQYEHLLETSASGGRKGAAFSAEIRQLAADIERKEGRNVEQIKRKILAGTTDKKKPATTPRRSGSFGRGGYKASPQTSYTPSETDTCQSSPAGGRDRGAWHSRLWGRGQESEVGHYDPKAYKGRGGGYGSWKKYEDPPTPYNLGRRGGGGGRGGGRGGGGGWGGGWGGGGGGGGWGDRYSSMEDSGEYYHSSYHQGGYQDRYEEEPPAVGYSDEDQYRSPYYQESNRYPSARSAPYAKPNHTSNNTPGYRAAAAPAPPSPQPSSQYYQTQTVAYPDSSQYRSAHQTVAYPDSSQYRSAHQTVAYPASSQYHSSQLPPTHASPSFGQHPAPQSAVAATAAVVASPQLGSMMQPGSVVQPPQATTQQPTPLIPVTAPQLVPAVPQQQSAQPSVAQLQGALANINSEEDAEKALQLSSALTQALLAYRLKNVSTTADTPLSSLLSVMQAGTK